MEKQGYRTSEVTSQSSDRHQHQAVAHVVSSGKCSRVTFGYTERSCRAPAGGSRTTVCLSVCLGTCRSARLSACPNARPSARPRCCTAIVEKAPDPLEQRYPILRRRAASSHGRLSGCTEVDPRASTRAQPLLGSSIHNLCHSDLRRSARRSARHGTCSRRCEACLRQTFNGCCRLRRLETNQPRKPCRRQETVLGSTGNVKIGS
mmetsp:Transcript_123350/g.213962  ORF Transcript_123350/g.213962 Transcript_123350/m.213962 type:complete len:205 (+) Transcript_123350:289-903(+)